MKQFSRLNRYCRGPQRFAQITSLAGLLLALACCGSLAAGPLPEGTPVKGWTLLSESEGKAQLAIEAAAAYGINHLQLSHKIVHDLNEVDRPATRALVNRLAKAAHQAGIEEVVLWDHALYALDYYPEAFRTGPGGAIDLDNPAFWQWLKADYRRLLDKVPDIDGLVLTFIETGARVEHQHSLKLESDAARLAAVVNAVADVVIGERGLTLYARTFSYTRDEFANVLQAVSGFERPEVRLMMKETPHDFFIPHPPNASIGAIDRPTLVEFDAAGEYYGQSVIASTVPELLLRRVRALRDRPNVLGYVARTDRYGDTQIVGRPGEINLLAISRGFDDPGVTAEQIYDEFISERYGKAALPAVKSAFRRALDIAYASLYTLGTDAGNRHSRLNYDSHTSSYVRHVPGKWMEPPIVYLHHGLNREFHYWRDVVNYLAPAYVKDVQGPLWDEVPEVRASGWIRPGDQMNEDYLRMILVEKDFGLAQARAALDDIERARPALTPGHHAELQALFYRTWLTARLHRAVAAAYFGFRVWARGPEYRSEYVTTTTQRGLEETRRVATLVREYPGPVPKGQWDWRADADRAGRYYQAIAIDGWPAETNGLANPEGGMTFPLADSRPNILWIIVDDMSANLSSYGETAIETPHLDELAERGVLFSNAYVTAPVCSANRSAFITGMYQTSIGSHHHRSGRGELKIQLPDGVRPIPEHFREAGYYTAITGWPNKPKSALGKTDYNFEWDRSMYDGADWGDRRKGQPFFAQIQLPGGKHRGNTLEENREFRAEIKETLGSVTDLSRVRLPPYYPNDPVLVEDWAAYLDSVRLTDRFVGDIIERLEQEGDLENTVIVFMTDHGISHARGKQFLYDEGLHVPLIISGPGVGTGRRRDDLVEHIDIAALSLALAGIEIPSVMQARDILSPDYRERTAVFAARDRCDETVDHIRGLRTQRFKYIRNTLYQRPHMQPNRYKDNKDIVKALRAAHEAGTLNEVQESLFASPRPREELYDLEADPFEIMNLAGDPAYAGQLEELRTALDEWIRTSGDMGPESAAMYDSDMAVYISTREKKNPAQARVLKDNIALMKRWAAEGK